MKEELYVITPGGQRLQLDLPNPSGITLKWVSNLFNDLSKLTCSYSYTFKLPMTRNNRVVFDQVEDIRHKSEFAGKKIDAEFIMNGVPICRNANLYISEVGSSSYSCVMTWGVLKAFQTLKGSSLKLNELASVGNIYWNDDTADDILYGKLTRKMSNTDNVVYPDYDAGCPHYDGTPPKPCMPIYRIIQLINEKFGVKFKIGQSLPKDLGIMPLADFNNYDYHNDYVYDDYVTHGVLPLVNTIIDGASQAVKNLRQLSSFTMKSLDQSGTRKWQIAHAEIHNGSSHINYYSVIGLVDGEELPTPVETIVGIPTLREFKETEIIKPLYAGLYSKIGDETRGRFQSNELYKHWLETGVKFEVKTEELEYHDQVYSQFSALGKTKAMGNEYFKKLSHCIGFVCYDSIELFGSLKLHLSKEAVDAGRVTLDEYRWITLALVKSNGSNSDMLEKENTNQDRFVWSWGGRIAEWETVSDKDVDRWLGLQSATTFVYDEASDSYVYQFDFGVEYPVRRLQIDEVEVGEGQVGGYFFIPYWPEDEMETITDVDENGNENKREELRLKEGDIYISDFYIQNIEPTVNFYGFPALMDITQNLPNISCFDFMKAVFYMNGAMPKVADDGETIVPMYYNQIRDRVYHGIAKDWSNKLVGDKNQQSEKINFSSSSFAQNNYYEMAYTEIDKTDEELADELDMFDTGHGCVKIDNTTLSEKTSIYKAPFYPGIMQDRQYPMTIVGRTTKIWNGNKVYTTEAKPVYGIMVYRALNDEFEDISNPNKRHMQFKFGADCRQIRMDVFNPFKNMTDVFGYLVSILQNYVLVKEKLRLTELDVVNLDMSIPVYLSKYNAFFAISTLQRDSKGEYTAEFVKLPYVKPEYAKVEDDLTSIITGDDEPAIDPDEGKPIVTTWELYSSIMSFELNQEREASSNLIRYDYFANGQYEGWDTSSNKLSVPVNGYMPRYVLPTPFSVNGNDYTMRYYVPNVVTYCVKTTKGSKTLESYYKTAKLRAYLDDVLIEPGWNEFKVKHADDGKHCIFKFMLDIVDKENNMLDEYRKKLYYFTYTVDESIITGDFGEEHEGDEKIPISTCTVSGDESIGNGMQHKYTLVFGPSYANVQVSSVEVSTNAGEMLTVSDVSMSGFTLQAKSLPDTQTEVIITINATLSDGSSFITTHSISLSKAALEIVGKDIFDAVNGSGSSAYTISVKPYSPITAIKSITSSNSAVKAEKQKETGFTLNVADTNADITSTITVVVESGGMEITGTKEISVKYKNTWLISTLDDAGVLIVDINGMFYNETEWKDLRMQIGDADGIAVSDGTHRFKIAKNRLPQCAFMDPVALVSGQVTAENTAEAYTDFNGKENTDAVIAAVSKSAAHTVRDAASFPSGSYGYIGAVGEWMLVKSHISTIQKLLEQIGGQKIEGTHWTSTQQNNIREWSYDNGSISPYEKGGWIFVRPFAELKQIEKPVVRGGIELSGESSFNTSNGEGTAEFGLSFTPAGASVSEVSVTSSNETFIISDVSNTGFKVSVSNVVIDRNTTITVKARVNGLIESATKNITAIGSTVINFEKLDSEKALIMDKDCNLYTESEWYAANKWFEDAEGIAVSDGTHRFIIAKEDTGTAQFGGYGGTLAGVDNTGKGYDGETYTKLLVDWIGTSYEYAARMAKEAAAFPSGEKGYLGGAGEWRIVGNNYDLINSLLEAIQGDSFPKRSDGWWTSSLYSTDTARAYTWALYGKGMQPKACTKTFNAIVRVFRKIQ